MKNEIKLFSIGNNQALAVEIAQNIGVNLSPIEVGNFSDGEIKIKLDDDCRDKRVYLVQSTNQPESNFTKLILAIDAARRAGAREIVAVVPYLGYTRQERLSEPGVPISAKVFATILETLGLDRLVTIDLHSKAIEGFFLKTRVDHIETKNFFVEILKKDFEMQIKNNEVVVVAPDTGAANNARSFSNLLLGHSELAIVSKSRLAANVIAGMQLVGSVKDKIAVVVDDMADTCGTITKSAELLKKEGARKVVVVVTHAIFSGNAKEKLQVSAQNKIIDKIYTTNTIESSEVNSQSILETSSVAGLLSKYIY